MTPVGRGKLEGGDVKGRSRNGELNTCGGGGGYLRVYEGGRELETKESPLLVRAKEDENSERATGYLQFKAARM